MTRPESRPAGWSARLGLRARLLLVSLGGVAVALLLAGVLFYLALARATDQTLDAGAEAVAGDVAALVQADRVPDPLPVSGAQVVQVVDAQQRVVAGSATADRLAPLLRPTELQAALAGEAVQVPGGRVGLATPLRVRALAVEGADLGDALGPLAVVVAVPVGDVLAARASLRRGLLLGLPLLLVVVGLLAWRVLAATLRPVEELRAGAAAIAASDAPAEQAGGSGGPGGAGRAGPPPARLPVPPAADEIRALAQTLNEMLDRLDAGRARQRSFVADAAHELRSPLTAIRTQLEVAQQLGEGGRLPGELLADVGRLSRLVEDLLLLARADADRRGPAHPELLDLDALAEQAGAASAALARVPVRVAAEPVQVRADADELRRVLQNLLDNAVRHAATAVGVEVTADGPTALLRVRDDGPGLPAAERERVFERFTRRDDARSRDAGGSGLGLAIVRELVVRAGGSVGFLDPPDGVGALVEVRLPCVGAA